MRTAVVVLVCVLSFLVSNCGRGIESAVADGKSGSLFGKRHQRSAPRPPMAQTPQTTPVNYSDASVNAQGIPVSNPLPAPVYIPQPGDNYAPSGMPAALGTLFVIISGNSTCNPAVFSSPMPGLVNSSLFESFISTMMNTGYVKQNDNIIFACFETLSPQMQVYDVKYRPQMVSIHESQLDGIVIPQAQQADRVVVIGHSYGGWKSMKLLSSPQMQSYVQAPIQLVTVDPISKINCTNPLMPGCRQAPSDFTDVEFAVLNSRTRWLNAVQEPGIVVGSDAMPAAHVNLKFTGVNHFSIVTDQRLWQAITQFVPR